MQERFVSRFLGVLAGASLALAACGDSDKPRADGGMDAGDPGADAETDSGEEDPEDAGDGPKDGGADAGDAGATDAAASVYRCEPPPPPDGTLPLGDPCCAGLGTCEETTSGTEALSVGDCNAEENLRCVPLAPGDGGTDAGPNTLATCRMQLADAEQGDPGFEGRCVPECLTRGSASLEQSECESGFVCVPCYSPVTAEDTGACRNGGDQPAEDPPAGFSECGDALGYCISTALVSDTGATLQQLSCDDGEICAPKQRVIAPDSCFAQCDSLLAGPGACVPAFLVPEASRDVLQQSSCMSGERCSPCINPLNQTRTGACD